MFTLRKIEIYGFQSTDRQAVISLSENPVSVIYGENGCGKTTFLKLIYGFLNRKSAILRDAHVAKMVVTYLENSNEEKKVSVELKKMNVVLENRDNDLIEVESYDWSELEQSSLVDSKSLSLGVERGVTSQALKVEVKDIVRFLAHPKYRGLFRHMDRVDFAEELNRFMRNFQSRQSSRIRRNSVQLDEQHSYLQSIKMDHIEDMLLSRYQHVRSMATDRIQNALFDTLSLVIDPAGQKNNILPSIPEDFANLLIQNKDRIIEALDDGFDNNFKSQVISILMEVNNKDEAFGLLENRLLSQLIINMIKELEYEKQLLGSINILVDTFNEYLVGNKKLVVTMHEIYVEVEGGRHTVSVLSSGERHILTFLSLVVIAGSECDFIIIDEPEISLNIKWQRTLMSLLQKLAPKTQIIVASHSSIIAKKIPTSLVELVPEKIAL